MKRNRLSIAIAVVLLAAGGCSKPRSSIGLLENSTSSAGSPPNTPTYGVQNTPDSRIRMGARDFVASSLQEIFLNDYATAASGSPEATAYSAGQAALTTLVVSQVDFFGGACDKYEADCSGSQSQAAAVPAAATARLALTIRACDKLAANDTLVKHAIARALGTASAGTINAPTDRNIRDVYGLFYPDRTPPPSVFTGLKALIQASQAAGYPAIDAWRYLLLTLCHSPDWQIT